MGQNHALKRDDRGRYLAGHRGGPGRPPMHVEENYLRSLREEVPLSKWRAIATKAVKQAIEGDWKAREWLSRYLLPEPDGKRSDPLDLASLIHAFAEEDRHGAGKNGSANSGKVIDQSRPAIGTGGEWWQE